MPQLNPNPWFLIMLTSWLTFSLIIQPKLMTFISTNHPTKTPTTTKTTPWPWPWT
uniref:ATP synthase complex subunit 8 n=3 Tax=Spheniscus TaxID=9239 RepID=A0A343AZ30_SPHME|nr:ATP synthase F0 subunit 8 [Spheniscus demersus]YP_009442050.1 ATP synthase F0 subunit 8 [Spheniscus mendiculus]YP_009442975.1 ATP synthase F0 subunit 8 [Spheniscus humboldti]AAT72187.1 ATP synthase F0 subunit 8 [Spheniscus demersus]AAT72188.1 ATP synthase F0 subunit 8 [Spheniscus humboldti]AGO90240.1 ATP synthase F0 subunit 8 [Spheniscus demersus]AJO68682.1 ATP synthase F0 subunit 8 [Spheniscus humboldti]AON77380.1 ATP synthase F0 subunit 8 [Spheniscus humboldti]